MARRDQLRRRRAVAFIAVAVLVACAVWAAYAIPGRIPASIPEGAAAPVIVNPSASSEEVVVARVQDIDVLLPVARPVTTAVAYHAVDNDGAVPFVPNGDRVSGGGLSERLADVFAGGGGVRYYLATKSGGRRSSSTAGLDVGAVPGSGVVSPIDGRVVAIKRYRILGRYNDVELKIQFAGDPSLILVVTHLAEPRASIGDTVVRGKTALGTVRGFPASLDQALSRYTSDNGDHVQLMVLRITPDLEGS